MAVPRRPPPDPLRTNDRLVVVVGTSLWAAALVVVLAVQWWTEHRLTQWAWVCAAAIFLGGVGLRHLRQRRVTHRDENAAPATAGQADPVEPLP